jgi:hypothetical protein
MHQTKYFGLSTFFNYSCVFSPPLPLNNQEFTVFSRIALLLPSFSLVQVLAKKLEKQMLGFLTSTKDRFSKTCKQKWINCVQIL